MTSTILILMLAQRGAGARRRRSGARTTSIGVFSETPDHVGAASGVFAQNHQVELGGVFQEGRKGPVAEPGFVEGWAVSASWSA